MKHIRLFNESNKEDYYTIVSEEEWEDFEPINLEEKIFKKIDSLIDKKTYHIRFEPFSAYTYTGGEKPNPWDLLQLIYRKSANMSPRDGKYSCSIFTSGDDWYWVNIKGESLYKCDQDTGLIMLLKDKGII